MALSNNFKSTRNYLILGLTFLLFLFLAVELYLYGSKEVVQVLGKTNSYLLGFILGILGGASFFFSAAFYTLEFVMVKGGLNPYILGIAAGTGLTIGDSLFYLMGFKGRDITHGGFRKRLDNFGGWLAKQSLISVIVVVFFCVALTPIPNGVLMASTGLAHYRYKIIFPIALLGNIFFLTFIGVIARNSINFLLILVPTLIVLAILLIVDKIFVNKK